MKQMGLPVRRMQLLISAGLSILLLLLFGGAFAGTAEAADREPHEICGDGIDNDGDGRVDMADDCQAGLDGESVSGLLAVVPETWDLNGNAPCAELGFGYGFKLDGIPVNGTYSLTNADGALTGGATPDENNSVTIENADPQFFDWSSTLGMDAVFVKGGNLGGNLYVYDPEADADTNLSLPSTQDISHIEFCFDYELDVSKTAGGSYDRTITWELDKSVAPETHSGFAGDQFTSTWTVEATKTVVEDNHAVSGDITIINPSPGPVDIDVEDEIDGTIEVDVVCPTTTLPAFSQIICTYTADASDGIDGDEVQNVVAVTSLTDGVDGGTATAPISFTANVTGSESLTVDDDLAPSNVLPTDIDDSKTFIYDQAFECSTDADDYTDGSYTENHPNTATGDPGNLEATADVDLTCYLWSVTKTAEGSYHDEYTWDITKSVDPESQSGFAGDTLDWTWSIEWAPELVGPTGHQVTGEITVTNPADQELTVDVVDELTGGIAVTVTCNDSDGGTALTIGANSSGTCDYSADVDSQLAENTATATRNDVSVADTVPVGWTKGADVVPAIVSIDDSSDVAIDPAADQPFAYADDHQCSTDADDYTDGSYAGSADNTVTINWDGGSDQASAETAYTCYLWSVSKTADGTYHDEYAWEITKSVDPASQSGFAGETLQWTWSIGWAPTVTETGYQVTGVITVDNPAAAELTVDVADALGGVSATVVCDDADGGSDLTVAGEASGTCDYTAAVNSLVAENTATASRNGVAVDGTADVSWVKGDDVGNDPVISDTVGGETFSIAADGPQPYEFSGDHLCSADADDYTAGSYTGSVENTVEITWTGGADDASAVTQYTCYLWSVSKTADGTYHDEYDWTITKSVDVDSQSGFAGDELSWEWTIEWSPTVTEVGHEVTGVITVTNPAKEELTVDVADQLSDGTDADVNCDGVGGTSLTINAGGSAGCAYTATVDSQVASNTATASANGVDVSAPEPVTWVAGTPTGLDITIEDTGGSIPHDSPTAIGGSHAYGESETCSTLAADYLAGGGTYSKNLLNEVTITWDGGQAPASASAMTAISCEAAYVELKKLTNGVVDPGTDWTFELFEGPDGFDGTQVGSTSTTAGDADGVLDFGSPPLNPANTYTICEVGLSAGWTAVWSLAGLEVTAYNPNADDPVPEDVGNRCVDIGAGTSYPLSGDTVLLFEVDNTYPKGDPRTPGYWKNWSTCSSGNQAATAEKNDGVEAGFYLLDDVLPITIGDLIVETCDDGRDILDRRDIGSGRKMASDAAYNLASHLLAAKANVAADAASCADLDAAILAGDALLGHEDINFDGTGKYLRPKDDHYVAALTIAADLDAYNNGELCP